MIFSPFHSNDFLVTSDYIKPEFLCLAYEALSPGAYLRVLFI